MKEPINLQQEIELLREKMIASGLKHGLTAPNTIDLSKKLDIKMNLLH